MGSSIKNAAVGRVAGVGAPQSPMYNATNAMRQTGGMFRNMLQNRQRNLARGMPGIIPSGNPYGKRIPRRWGRPMPQITQVGGPQPNILPNQNPFSGWRNYQQLPANRMPQTGRPPVMDDMGWGNVLRGGLLRRIGMANPWMRQGRPPFGNAWGTMAGWSPPGQQRKNVGPDGRPIPFPAGSREYNDYMSKTYPGQGPFRGSWSNPMMGNLPSMNSPQFNRPKQGLPFMQGGGFGSIFDKLSGWRPSPKWGQGGLGMGTTALWRPGFGGKNPTEDAALRDKYFRENPPVNPWARAGGGKGNILDLLGRRPVNR